MTANFLFVVFTFHIRLKIFIFLPTNNHAIQENMRMSIINCPECGSVLDRTHDKCPECGKTNPLITQVRKRNKKILTMILLAFFTVIIIIIIIVLIYMNVFPLKRRFDSEEQFYLFYYVLGLAFVQYLLAIIAMIQGSEPKQLRISNGLLKEKCKTLRNMGIIIIVICTPGVLFSLFELFIFMIAW